MEKIIKLAKKHLKNGNLVIFPTETVYGLGGDATNKKAIDKIYELKKRPKNNPLICHFYNLHKIEENFEMNKLEKKIAKKFWPGPLTIILKKKNNSNISSCVSNGSKFIGCRIPQNKIALELLNSVSFPIAAPSANLATKVSATRHNDVSKTLTESALLIKSRKAKFGLESTVIKIDKDKVVILRLGSITEEIFKEKLSDIAVTLLNKNNLLSPGNQNKHYSPILPIRINAKNVKNDECLLNFGKNKLKSKIYELNLSLNSDLNEAAKNFFHFLNLLDKKK